MRVFYQHARSFGLHAPDAPRSISEQHNVACLALDREIFVDCPNISAIGLGYNREESIVRNRAAAGDRRQSRSATRSQSAIHFVVMHIRAVTSALRGDALRQHRENFIEALAREISVGIGPLHEREQFVLIPSIIQREADARVGSYVEFKNLIRPGGAGGIA